MIQFKHNMLSLALLFLDSVPIFMARRNTLFFSRFLDNLPDAVKKGGGFIQLRRFFPDNASKPTQPRLVQPQANLVIEGFPGSGNTFVAGSVRQAVSHDFIVESHFHYTTQLKRAIAFNVPCLVVVRDPVNAGNSLKYKEPLLWDWLILLRWWHYHAFVWQYRHQLTIFCFNDLVEDVDLVRRKMPALKTHTQPITPRIEHRNQSRRSVQIKQSGFWHSWLVKQTKTRYKQLMSMATTP